MITIKKSAIVTLVTQIKETEAVMNVWVNITPDGTLSARWFYGRSDFVLKDDLIVLPGVGEQSAEAIVYAICMVLRNRERYRVSLDE